MSRRRRKMYCGHARLCVCVCVCLSVCVCDCVSVCVTVCLSTAVRPHYCTDPDVTWGRGRGCPLVVQGGFAIGAQVALLWQHNVNPSYKLASILQYDYIVRTLGGVCVRCWSVTGGWRGHSQNCAPYMASRCGWLAGDWPLTGGVLNITAAAWTAGFQWWRSGDITRTQNISKYTLVLALCLVVILLSFDVCHFVICQCT